MSLQELAVIEAPFAAAYLLALGAVAVGIIPIDRKRLRVAGSCFVMSALIFGGIGVMWGFTSEMPFWPRTAAVFLICGLAGVASVQTVRFLTEHKMPDPTANAKPSKPAAEKPQIEPPLYAAQLEQLREIDSFIGRKDETELRETFDLPKMIKFNTLMAKGQLFPGSLSPAEGKEIDAFFAGGQAQIDIRYANLTSVHNAAHFERVPGKFGLINLSSKYAQNLQRLNELIESATVPSEIRKELIEFKEALSADTRLQFEVINDCFQVNPQQVFQDNIYGAQLYGSVVGAYAVRFIALRPKADAVNVAIRKYLGVH